MKKIILFFTLLFAVCLVFAQKTTTSANVLIAKDRLKVGNTSIKQIDTTLALPSHDGVPTTQAVINALSGVGGQNFANADLTATGDRTHEFGFNNLSILKTNGIENYGIGLTNTAFMYSHNVGSNSYGFLSSSGGAAKMQAYGNSFLGFKTFEVNKDAFIFNQYGVNNAGKWLSILDSTGTVGFLNAPVGQNISNADLTMQANHVLDGANKSLVLNGFQGVGISGQSIEIGAVQELNFYSTDVMNFQSDGSVTFQSDGSVNFQSDVVGINTDSYLRILNGQNNTGKYLQILNTNGEVGFVVPPPSVNIGTHDLTLTGNRNLFLVNNQFTISNSHKFSMGNNWAAFNFLGSNDGLGIESNTNVVLRARDLGKRISFDSPNIFFQDVTGVDNTGKVLTILNSAGKLGYTTQSAGGIASIIGGEGVTITNSNVINIGGTVSNTRNLDMGTAGALVLKNIQNTTTPERDVLVLTNDANPISGGDAESVGIKFDVADNITRLAASDEETQLKANKPIYITKQASGTLGGSNIVVGSGDMTLLTTSSTGQQIANLSISGTSISSLNYNSSRNDAGNPASIASFDASGTLQRHPISELGIPAPATFNLSSNGNVMTATHNNVVFDAPIVNSNVLAAPANVITSTVNGVASSTNLVKTVSTSIINGQLVTTVNGVASTPVAVASANYSFSFNPYKWGETMSNIGSPLVIIPISSDLAGKTTIKIIAGHDPTTCNTGVFQVWYNCNANSSIASGGGINAGSITTKSACNFLDFQEVTMPLNIAAPLELGKQIRLVYQSVNPTYPSGFFTTFHIY